MSPPVELTRLRVLRSLPDPPAWATAKWVESVLEIYSYGTIKQSLLYLAREGKVLKFGPPESPAFRRIDIPDRVYDPLPALPSADIDAEALNYHRNLDAWKRK